MQRHFQIMFKEGCSDTWERLPKILSRRDLGEGSCSKGIWLNQNTRTMGVYGREAGRGQQKHRGLGGSGQTTGFLLKAGQVTRCPGVMT